MRKQIRELASKGRGIGLCIDCTKENDKDGISFEDDIAAEILDCSCEAGDIQAIADLCTHLTAKQ